MSQYDYPMLRNLEVIPIDLRDQPGVALRDPLQYAAEMIALPREALAVLQFFDGKRSIDDILDEISKQYGGEGAIGKDDILTLVKSLDDHHFLLSEKFLKEKRRIEEEFYRSNIRHPIHSGISYSDDPEILRQELESYFSKVTSISSDKNASDKSASDNIDMRGDIRAAIAPHISISSGGECFAHAYNALKAEPVADLYIILGIGHAGLDNCFAGTKKDFETPLGTVKTDSGFLERLNKAFDSNSNSSGIRNRLFSGEALHRTEHTIEFQVVMLKHILGETPFAIAPILTSFPHQFVVEDRFEGEKKMIDDFIVALKGLISSYSGRVVIIASVDFAHVGVKYGSDAPLTEAELEDMKRRDSEMIEIISKGDASGFLSHISEDSNKRNICGFSAIYTMLSVIDGLSGCLLNYDETIMDDQNSTVTFAGMVFATKFLEGR